MACAWYVHDRSSIEMCTPWTERLHTVPKYSMHRVYSQTALHRLTQLQYLPIRIPSGRSSMASLVRRRKHTNAHLMWSASRTCTAAPCRSILWVTEAWNVIMRLRYSHTGTQAVCRSRRAVFIARKHVHRVSLKKTIRYLIAHNFGKCWPIFKILSLSDSADKRVMKESLNIPPLLKRVVTLPCEM